MTRGAAGAGAPVMVLVTGVSEYQLRVIKGMHPVLDERGVSLLVVANDPLGEDRVPSLILDLIRRREACGVIALGDVSPFPQGELPEAIMESGLPAVTLGMPLGGHPVVVSDNVGGMRELMRHLLDEHGVRRPVLVKGIPGHQDSEAREKVYREEMARRGLEVDEDLVLCGYFRVSESYDALHRLLLHRRDFEAVVALNDMSAFGAVSALNAHGLQIPQDVLVTGFDNTQGAITTWPPLTTIDQNLEEQGRKAVELLLAMIEGLPHPSRVAVPARLVARVSTSGVGPDGDEVARTEARTMSALQTQVSVQDAAAHVSSSLAKCRTMDDVVAAMEPRLTRLGVDRCFLALDAQGADGGDVASSDAPSRLVFSYRRGTEEEPPDEVFPRAALLPSSLNDELGRGVLLLQVLSAGGRDRGFLLFEPTEHSYLLTESLRVDLPRSVDVVLSWQEMRDHSAMLERLVADRTRELERANAELRRSVMRDGLTGIANRLAFQQHVEQLLATGTGRPLSLLMVDVDMFKAFNDHYGHLAGDAALRTVAGCLQGAARGPQDLACRYGGEEFALVLADADAPAALGVAERFRRLLAEAAVPHAASTVAPVVTASLGLASVRTSAKVDPTEIIAAADRALYQAKAQGRDRVVVSGAGPAVPRQGVPALAVPRQGTALHGEAAPEVAADLTGEP